MVDTRETPAESEDAGSDLSAEDRFDLLSNGRRRYTIQHLAQNRGSATVGDLADRLAARENDKDVEAVSHDERKSVYTSLRQLHLPRLDEADVVQYDDSDGTVELGPAGKELYGYLDTDEEGDVHASRSYLYLGLACLNALLLAAVGLGILPSTLLPDLGLIVIALVTFGVAVAHLVSRR